MGGQDWTFWLNVTNYVLGAVTGLALLIVLGAVGWELIEKKARKATEMDLDAELQTIFHVGPHSLSVPGLGLTMADGGERIEPSKPKDASQKSPRK